MNGGLNSFLRIGPLLKLGFAVVLLTWPLVHQSQYALNVMATAGLYALLTISVTLVIGQAGQLSFGHAAFYGIGAYAASLSVVRYGMPTIFAPLVGALASTLVALVVGRPVLKLRYFYLALATIGLGQIFTVLVIQFRDVTGGWNGLAPVPKLDLFGFSIDTYMRKYYVVWAVALLVLVFTERALKHRTGRSLRALATSEIAASTLGVRTANWKLLAFVVSAGICGIAGSLFAFNTGALTPGSFSFSAAVLPVIMMLLGGSETLWGGVLGAIVLTWVLNAFSGAAEYSGLIYSAVMVLLLLFLPNGVVQGVTGARARWVAMLLRLRPATGAGNGAIPEPVAIGLNGTADSISQARPASPVIPHGAGGEVVVSRGSGRLGVAAVEGDTKLPTGEPLLVVDDVSVDFGGLRAVNRVSMSVFEGQIVALIGPNGAGKTTLFNVISHLQRPSSGSVTFGGQLTSTMPASSVARLGVARTFQNLRIFDNMSVLENALVGCHRHEHSWMLGDGLGLASQRREERESVARATEALRLVGLEDRIESPAGSLPYGEQRLVEIARALASEPRLLLLDEPAAGLNSSERTNLADRIALIRDSGITVLLVEHDIDLVMGMSDRVDVLDHGVLIASGPPETVRDDPAVVEAYLGTNACAEPKSAASVRTDGQSQERVPLLSVAGLSTNYGPIRALSDVSFDVFEGETVVILGANGAGKTTLLHTISGRLHPSQGRVKYRGDDMTREPAARIAARGISQVPEGRQVFSTLSVEDNLLVGTASRRRQGDVGEDLAAVYDLFPILVERRKQPAGTLSGGQQQMLAIGRALMGRPQLLLLDEPSMGLAPLVVEHIFEALRGLSERGLTILMVEQNAELALAMADYGLVLQTGFSALSGPAETLRNDPRVRECYLGQT